MNSFPFKLWELINSSVKNGVYWCKKGQKVIIVKSEFQRKCLDRRKFNARKLSSIVRQLNSYGFSLVKRSPNQENRYIYKHKYFKKGKKELLYKICAKYKGFEYNNESDSFSSDSTTTSGSVKKLNRPLTLLDKARRNFKSILRANVKILLNMKCYETPSESETDDDDNLDPLRISPSFKMKFAPLPERHDPKYLLWNGNVIKPNSGLSDQNSNLYREDINLLWYDDAETKEDSPFLDLYNF